LVDGPEVSAGEVPAMMCLVAIVAQDGGWRVSGSDAEAGAAGGHDVG